jgi:hypothetical protein
MTKELVVSSYFDDKARYIEDISWLNRIDPSIKIYLYNKNENNHYPNSIHLPNIGREGHTYIQHICENYDTLSEYLFFFQGYPFDHTGSCIEIINEDLDIWNLKSQLRFDGYWGYCHNYFGTMWNLDKAIEFEGDCLRCDKNGKPHHHENIPCWQLWEEMFDCEIPETLEFNPGNQFNVSRDLIKQRGLDFWKKLLALSYTRELWPWELERLMPYMMNPKYKSK